MHEYRFHKQLSFRTQAHALGGFFVTNSKHADMFISKHIEFRCVAP